MSGAEAAAGPSYDWAVNFGSVLGIIVSISVVAGAAYRIIAYVRNNVRKEVVENREIMNTRIAGIEKKIDSHYAEINGTIKDKVMNGRERVTEIKWWMEKIEKQVDENTKLVHRIAEESRTLSLEITKLRAEVNGAGSSAAQRADHE